MDRRTFLSRVTSIFSLLTAALFTLPLIRFFFGFRSEAEGGWYRLAAIDAPELSEEVSRLRYLRVLRQGWHSRVVEEVVWVRKQKDGSFVVFNTHCTHLGCAVSWNQQDRKFQCPCHGGVFDVDGKRVEGPPPAPLQRYETKIDKGTLRIGKLLKS